MPSLNGATFYRLARAHSTPRYIGSNSRAGLARSGKTPISVVLRSSIR